MQCTVELWVALSCKTDDCKSYCVLKEWLNAGEKFIINFNIHRPIQAQKAESP